MNKPTEFLFVSGFITSIVFAHLYGYALRWQETDKNVSSCGILGLICLASILFVCLVYGGS